MVTELYEIDKINDPLKKARDVKDIGLYSSCTTEIIIVETTEIPYILSLIKLLCIDQ